MGIFDQASKKTTKKESLFDVAYKPIEEAKKKKEADLSRRLSAGQENIVSEIKRLVPKDITPVTPQQSVSRAVTAAPEPLKPQPLSIGKPVTGALTDAEKLSQMRGAALPLAGITALESGYTMGLSKTGTPEQQDLARIAQQAHPVATFLGGAAGMALGLPQKLQSIGAKLIGKAAVATGLASKVSPIVTGAVKEALPAAAVFGGQTAIEGGSPMDIAKSAGMGLVGGGLAGGLLARPAAKLAKAEAKMDQGYKDLAAKITGSGKVAEVKPVEPIKISEMSRKQFDAKFELDKPINKKTMENLVESVGKKVADKTGTTDIKSILESYKSKYKLPEDTKLTYDLKKETRLGTSSVKYDTQGNVVSAKISINPNQSELSKIGALRHEIEHVKDLQNKYTPVEGKIKPVAGQNARQSVEAVAGKAHQNYSWFEPDYLRKATVKDAIKAGEKVPQSVIDEFGGIEKLFKGQPIIVSKPTMITPVNKLAEVKAVKSVEMKPAVVGKQVKGIEAPPSIKPQFNQTSQVTRQIPIAPKLEVGVREAAYSKRIREDVNAPQLVKQALQDEPFKYKPDTNAEQWQRATAKFNAGYENALADFTKNPAHNADDVILSKFLANEAAKRGDVNAIREIHATMIEKSVNAGRFSQAQSQLSKSDPAVFAETLSRQVNKINESGAKKIKGWKDVKISDKTMGDIYNLELFDEKAMKAMQEKVYKEINDQIPATRMEKFNAGRRMAMLLSPKTHIRNFVGNSLLAGAKKTSDVLAQGIEKVVLQKHPELKTKAIGWIKDKELKGKVNSDWENVKNDLVQYGKYDVAGLGLGNAEKKIFDNKTLEGMNNFLSKLMNVGDVPFLKLAYQDSLGQFIKARGLKEVTEEAREYATKQALKQTYRNTNALSTSLNKWKEGKVGNVIGGALVPFTKTPINVLNTAVDYSLVGLLNLFKSGKSAGEVIDILSKATVGTGTIGLGYYLGSMGLATTTKQEGEQPYSIKTPWGSYTFDWANPQSVPLAMGISIFNSFNKRGENQDMDVVEKTLTDLFSAAGAGADELINLSILKNLKELVGGYGSPSEKLLKTPVTYLEQFIPSILGAVARGTDTVQRETYDPSGISKEANLQQAKIPVLSQKLPAKVDVYGQPVKSRGIVAELLSPGKLVEENKSPAAQETDRLYKLAKEQDKFGKGKEILPNTAPKQIEYTDPKTKKVQKIILSTDEYVEFQKAMGQYNLEQTTRKIVGSNVSDDKKMKTLKTIADDSYEKAKLELLKKRGIK